MKRGEVYWVDLSNGEGSELEKIRPALIIQNDKGNLNSQTTIIAPISTHSRDFVTHVYCRKKSLDYRSQILLEQIRTVDKSRIGRYICTLNTDVMEEVNEKIKISLSLNQEERGEMVGELQVFNIGGVECYEKCGTAYLKLETVARGLGFTQEKNGVEYVRWDRVEGYLEEIGFPHKWGKDDFVPENVFYRLAMKAKNEVAEKFQAKVADEIIPSIRRTGGYGFKPMTPEQMMRIQLEMIDDVSGRVTKLENTMNIDYGQQRVLEKEVASVVIESLGGKDSNAYREISKKVFSECNRDVKDYFHVNSRANIPRLRFDDAVDYIRNWTPCSNTRMEIKEINS